MLKWQALHQPVSYLQVWHDLTRTAVSVSTWLRFHSPVGTAVSITAVWRGRWSLWTKPYNRVRGRLDVWIIAVKNACDLSQLLVESCLGHAGLLLSTRVVTPSRCRGYFLACEDFGRKCDHLFPACAFFFSSFFEVEISSRTLIPLFMPGSVHSDSASWDDCTRMFPDKLRVSSFPDRFPHYAWTAA